MCTTSHFYRRPGGAGSGLRRPWRIFALLSAAALSAALSACAARGDNAETAPDPEAEAAAVRQTVPGQALHVVFTWEMRDRDARFNGQGVLRVDRGYRARVDLFGPRGETYSAAIIDGEDMRVVPAASAALLPPAALLWSVLGVFRPPVDAPLTGTTRRDNGLQLSYQRDATTWRFDFENDMLRTTEWTARDGRRTVQLGGAAGHGLPQQASFRDWTEFRELTLRVTDVEERTAFGADVWILPGGF